MSKEYWQTVDKSQYWIKVQDPEGWYEATIKGDGCINLQRFFNKPLNKDPDSSNYLHICDIDTLIERLKALKQIAVAEWGEWPQ